MLYYAIAAVNILQFYFGINDTTVSEEHVSYVEETGQSHDDTNWVEIKPSKVYKSMWSRI